MPYCYFRTGSQQHVIDFVFSIAMDKKVNVLTIYNEKIVQYIKGGPYLIKKKLTRPYLISKRFLESQNPHPGTTPQDGDGDCAFI